MPQSRYDQIAIALHWTMAILLIGNLALGLWMVEAIDQADQKARAAAFYQLHKSIGLSLLMLSILRLAWRLSHRPPALPAGMPQWQIRLSHLVHVGLYGLMLAIPLSGWLYVSIQWRDGAALSVPTLFFGWFEVPHLFSLNELETQLRQVWAARLHELHEGLAFAMLLLLFGHIGAAIKHQWFDRDDLLLRMWPNKPRRWVLSLLILLPLAIVASWFRPASDTSQSSQISSDGWIVIPQLSHIEFSGLHAGDEFSGRFEKWHVDLHIDRSDVTASKIRTRIETASARTGDLLRDETLPENEWFDVKNHPMAQFESDRIERLSETSFLVHGHLRIKDRQMTVTPLALQLEAEALKIEAQLSVDRADFDLGMSSDPAGDWVSREIQIKVSLRARAP